MIEHMFSSFEALDRELDGLVGSLDVATVTPGEAARLVAVVDRIGRRAEAAKVLLAGRAATAPELDAVGARSAVEWLARATGVNRGRARRQLQTAERLASAPGIADAYLGGRLAAESAEHIAEAVSLVPGAEAELLEMASSQSAKRVRDHCRDLKARATTATDADELRARHWRARSFISFTTEELAGEARLRTTTDTLARLDALLQPHLQAVVDEARQAGRREARAAHRHDALLRALQLAHPDQASPGGHGPVADARPGAPDDRSGSAPTAAGGARSGRGRARRWGGVQAKVIFRVDYEAARRGRVLPGEVCEIAGHGPVPLSTLREVLDGADPFIAAVVTDATDVLAVTHFGRKAKAHQRTALEWLHPVCAIDGCDATTGLEIDHVVDWSITHHTQLDELVRLCGHHHDRKTNGWVLERIPGTRRYRQRSPGDPPAAGAA